MQSNIPGDSISSVFLVQDFAVIMIVAAVILAVTYKLKQPMIIGYIIAGMIIGPYTPPFSLIQSIDTLNAFSELGIIMFLLRSFTEGISNVWTNRFLVGLMYLFKLGSSLVLLFPLYVMFSASFGRNVKASNLVSGFDLSLVIDFVYCWRKTLPIYLATLVLVCVIVVLVFIFLSGGFWGILRDGVKKREGSRI